MRRLGRLVCLIFIAAAFSDGNAAADVVTGGEATYVVRRGDTIELVGARLAVDWWRIAKTNSIDIKKHLRVGQELRADTRRIVPQQVRDGIIINIPDRTLFLFKGGRLVLSLPVGLGKPPRRGKRDWSTPEGEFTVLAKEKNPTWHVPKSIQEEMAEEGRPVKTVVPPGPDNPLGKRAIKTSLGGILIHETIWPGSVYQYRSHGCIRILPEHMEQLFSQVEIGAPGRLIYKPVKVGISSEGRVLLEVRRDVYGRLGGLGQEAEAVIEQAGASGRVDWGKVERVVKEKKGIPEDVTL